MLILFYWLFGAVFFIVWLFTKESSDFLASIIFSGIANVLMAINDLGKR